MAKKAGKNMRAAEWEQVHANGYQKEIFSVTHDDALCDKIIGHVESLRDSTADIWIPGCGSVGRFEQLLANKRGTLDKIVCTDFEGVIKHVSQPKSPKITYQAQDSAVPTFKDNFDVVIPINSVVSGKPRENEAMLRHFVQALRPGGIMVGLFPTVICAQDIALTTRKKELKKAMTQAVDMKNSAVVDTVANSRQIFYTPGNLYRKLKKAGFDNVQAEITFFDTPYFKKEGKRMYHITDADVPIYELLVTAHKPYKPQ